MISFYPIFFAPSEDYAQLCNIPVPGSRRPYGQDALVDFEEHYTPETNPYFVEDRKQVSLLCQIIEMSVGLFPCNWLHSSVCFWVTWPIYGLIIPMTPACSQVFWFKSQCCMRVQCNMNFWYSEIVCANYTKFVFTDLQLKVKRIASFPSHKSIFLWAWKNFSECLQFKGENKNPSWQLSMIFQQNLYGGNGEYASRSRSAEKIYSTLWSESACT